MTVKYNVPGKKRKELVKAVSECLGCPAVYKGAPSFAYEIDAYTIDKNGVLSFSDRNDTEEVESLLEALEAAGFEPETNETFETDSADSVSRENVGFTVEIPFEKVNVGNLTRLLEAKGNLIKKSLCVSDIRIEMKSDRVGFPWFTSLPDPDEVKAYSHFISALCEMSRNAKRVTAKEKDVDNEKYAFRCFLLRLGFIGNEYKNERKILLKNLSGSSAFKTAKRGDTECSE